MASNESKEFDKLSVSEKEILVKWCKSLIKIKSFNKSITSYGLKHIFADEPQGFYVTNDAFKGAMLKADFLYTEPMDSPNWYFNVSQKAIKNIRLSQQRI